MIIQLKKRNESNRAPIAIMPLQIERLADPAIVSEASLVESR